MWLACDIGAMWRLGTEATGPEWRAVETPFDISLHGVVQTEAGPYAVGSRGHLVADRGDGWEVVFDDGPATRDNQLRAVDVTDDGKRVWMLGSSGAMACYDVDERRKFDYSYPNEMTSTWEGITVSGERGAEKALAANGSGEVLPFTVDGFDVDWGQLAKPAGAGSKMAALASTPDGVGFAVDTSGSAYKTTPDEGWTDIGIVNAQVKFYDIHAGANQQVYVAAGDGRIYRYDDSYHDWTPIGVADSTSLQAFDVHRSEDGEQQMVVLGADGSIFQRAGTERWEELPSPTNQSLTDLSLGDPDVAVGANGTVIERPRGEPRDAGESADGDEFDGRGENFDGDETGANDDPETTRDQDDPDDADSPDEDSVDEDTADEDTTAEDDPDADTTAEDEPDPDEDGATTSDAGISRWSELDDDPVATFDGSDAGGSTAGGETATATTSTQSSVEVETDAEVTADTETATADAETTASATTDAETKENVLVTIAERTDLEAVDVAEAAEQGSEIVEAVLAEIAEDVGIDPQRVREALNSDPERSE